MGRYDFHAGQRNYEGYYVEGLDHEILNFLGPKQLSLCLSCLRAQKSLIFHGPTLSMALVISLPHSKIIRGKPHIKKQVH